MIDLSSYSMRAGTLSSFVIPGPDWENQIGVKVFANQPVNILRVSTSVHDITIGLLELMIFQSHFSACRVS